MSNTQNGANEPQRVNEVDLRETGMVTLFCSDGTHARMTMDEYRNLLASGQISVDNAEFKTNAHNPVNAPETTELPMMPASISVPGNLVINETKPDKSDIPVNLKYARMFLFTVAVGGLTVMFIYHPAYALFVLMTVLLFLSNTEVPS